MLRRLDQALLHQIFGRVAVTGEQHGCADRGRPARLHVGRELVALHTHPFPVPIVRLDGTYVRNPRFGWVAPERIQS